MEQWKKIKDFENYEVSDEGRIRNTKTNRILKLKLGNRGYYEICLSNNGVKTNFRVHRLVASHFISNPNNLNVINHKDENKLNNCANNLEWCTSKYNTNYGNCIKKYSTKNKKPILMIKNGSIVKEYDSAVDAEKDGFIRSSISSCCKGIQKNHKGFEFKFKNNN